MKILGTFECITKLAQKLFLFERNFTFTFILSSNSNVRKGTFLQPRVKLLKGSLLHLRNQDRNFTKTFSCKIKKRPDLFMVFNYLRLKLKHFLKQFMIGRNFKFMVLSSDFYGHNTNESNLNISHDIMLI